MTFDHFDTQISLEETQYYLDWIDWSEYIQTLDSFDDETKRELDEVDMRIEQAESEQVVTTMRQLDRGPAKFA